METPVNRFESQVEDEMIKVREKENTEFQALVAASLNHKMTPKEIYEQKVSWLMGMSGKLSDPMRSRAEVVKAMAELGIIDPGE